MRRSTTVSDILSHILSGWPSETDSEVNRYELINLHSFIYTYFLFTISNDNNKTKKMLFPNLA